MDPDTSSIGFTGQYIREVTVKSDSDDTNVTLELLDDEKPYYDSAPLKGKGEIDYKKGDVSPNHP